MPGPSPWCDRTGLSRRVSRRPSWLTCPAHTTADRGHSWVRAPMIIRESHVVGAYRCTARSSVCRVWQGTPRPAAGRRHPTHRSRLKKNLTVIRLIYVMRTRHPIAYRYTSLGPSATIAASLTLVLISCSVQSPQARTRSASVAHIKRKVTARDQARLRRRPLAL